MRPRNGFQMRSVSRTYPPRSAKSPTVCRADVLMVVASMRGAVNGLTAEVMEDHIRNHIADPDKEDSPQAKGGVALIEVLKTYIK